MVNGLRIFMPAESRLLLDGVTVDFAETATSAGLSLDAATSARIFVRDGSIARLEVNLGPGFTGYTPPS